MCTKSAFEYGQDAFLDGTICSPTLDQTFLDSINDESSLNQKWNAWTDGWIKAQQEVTNTSWVGGVQ